jgi:DNA-binding LacI/PurR family transcriptional regulator
MKNTIKSGSHLILILLPDIENPFYSEVIRGIPPRPAVRYQEIIVRTGAHPLTYSFIESILGKTHADGVITLDPIPSAETIAAPRTEGAAHSVRRIQRQSPAS